MRQVNSALHQCTEHALTWLRVGGRSWLMNSIRSVPLFGTVQGWPLDDTSVVF
jgi:hypothetical protein